MAGLEQAPTATGIIDRIPIVTKTGPEVGGMLAARKESAAG